MDPEPKASAREEVERIFAEALDLPRSERDSFLDGACGGRPELRDRVEGLLRSNDATDFLDEPVSPEVGEMVAKLKPEEGGDRIGPYKLLQQIGEGGFGIVWMADQEQPVRRRVALKIIKMGMDTREVIARFEQERQALAMMDHPNIAKVLDAGATKFGRPFFVMELVCGNKITEYCDQANLPTEERLELFIKVCQAVQHAHQKGIIHRDLKPSNILVTLHDGVPVPKVIDFGVAKAIQQQRLTDLTLFTQLEQMIGTPLYMSPEQAEMSGLDIDTRSDIYSLGVLLYELLTGRTPFDPEDLMRKGYDEIRRVIRETEPQKPSTFLGTMAVAKRSTIAQLRHTDSGKLAGLLRGDLDWIVMKALEKDRSRRYETSSDLAQDIRRHLANEPVLAGAPSTFYRVRKFARRNKVGFSVIGIITAILFAATGVSLRQASLAKTAAIEAESARKQASANADAERAARQESDATVKFLTEVFQSPDPARDGRTITVAETLDRAVKALDSDLTDQPEVKASLRSTLGDTYQALGLVKDAVPLLEKTRDHYLKTLGPEHPRTLTAADTLALYYFEAGRRPEALKLQEEVLALRRKVLGPEHPDTISTFLELVHSYHYAPGRRPEARPLQEQVLALTRKVNGPTHQTTLRAISFMALYYLPDRGADALKLRDELAQLCLDLTGPESDQTLWARGSLANSWSEMGRHDEALKAREEVFAIRVRVLGAEHPDTLWSMNHLATSLFEVGRKDEAIKLLEEALALRRKASGEDHPDTLYIAELLGARYREMGRTEELITLLRKTLEKSRRNEVSISATTIGLMWRLGEPLWRSGRVEEGIKMLEECVMLGRTHGGVSLEERVVALNKLADVYLETGRFAESYKLAEEVLAFGRSGQRNKEIDIIIAGMNSSNALLALGRVDEALKMNDEIFATRPLVPRVMQWHTTLLLWFRRDHEHEIVCRRLLDEFPGGTEPRPYELVANACSLRASATPEMVEQALVLARKAVELGRDSVNLPMYQLALGLAEHRTGHFAEAEKWLNEVRDDPNKTGSLGILNSFVIAMNTFQLGQTEEARERFLKAETDYARFPKSEAERFAKRVDPVDLMIWLIHREAKTLIFSEN